MVTMLRPSRAVFRFSGPEAQKLLFDVLTGRITAEPGPAVWWALLSPQGKILAEGLCGWAEESFWLDVDAGIAEDFYRRMRMYRLRAKVEIEDLRATHVVGWRPADAGEYVAHADQRAEGLGWRVIASREEATAWDDGEAEWAQRRIAAGIAVLGPDFAPDTHFPHDIGMDLLGGIDFAKGCYVGQEVVSRMQHRGTARRRPVIVSGTTAPAGTPVLADGRAAGAIGAAVAGRAVAVLRLDRLTDPAAVTVADAPVELSLPGWAPYGFGESAPAD